MSHSAVTIKLILSLGFQRKKRIGYRTGQFPVEIITIQTEDESVVQIKDVLKKSTIGLLLVADL